MASFFKQAIPFGSFDIIDVKFIDLHTHHYTGGIMPDCIVPKLV